MSRLVPRDFQKGFALVNAIFLLVVLAFLGVVMVTLSGVQSRTPVFALQGAQAYYAARSGIEWGIARTAIPSCLANPPFAIGGFTVTVTCGALADGSYRIVSTATQGTYGLTDFVSRTVQVKVTP